MISPAQKIPGGLLGLPGLLEGIGGEVTATASLAAPASEILIDQVKVAQGGEEPAAKNCGLSTALVNLLAGLPSSAGHNKAVMIGDFEQTFVKWAQKYAKPPKEKTTK